MAKATRASENPTPKKRTRKAAVNSEATNGNGTEVVEVTAASPAIAEEAQVMPVLEEKIRVRAYELYLQRHGQHGTPEQDWLQAAQEICGQRIA